MTVDEALAAAGEVARAAVVRGYGVRAHVSGAFRDLTETNGETPAAETVRVIERLRAAHAPMVVALADTDGRAGEADVERVVSHVARTLGLYGVAVHLHDRGGNGLAKARAAYALGVRIFDAAAGGIGGNPTVLADAAGNLATEALVRALEVQGARTGVDWEALVDAGSIITKMAARVGDPPPPSETLAAALRARGAP
jgi:hydroxymethylglutaryl-CoA lyase